MCLVEHGDGGVGGIAVKNLMRFQVVQHSEFALLLQKLSESTVGRVMQKAVGRNKTQPADIGQHQKRHFKKGEIHIGCAECKTEFLLQAFPCGFAQIMQTDIGGIAQNPVEPFGVSMIHIQRILPVNAPVYRTAKFVGGKAV